MGESVSSSGVRSCRRCSSTDPWHSASLFCGPCREEITARGLCPRCGEHPLGDRKRYCLQCRDADVAKQREKVRKHREENPSSKPPCRGCGKPHSWPSKSFYCPPCREQMKERNLCQRCGENELMENGRFCKPCQDADGVKQKERHAQNQAAGLCRCGNEPVEGLLECAPCRVRARKVLERTRSKSKEAGRCPQCHQRPAAEGRTTCEVCIIAAQVRLRRVRLQVLAGYGGQCACCGETGERFLELDHVVRTWPEGQRRPPSETGSPLHLRVLKEGFPSAYQVLCVNCNWVKRLYDSCTVDHARVPLRWEDLPLEGLSHGSKWGRRLRMKVLRAYGDACACCGEAEFDCLALDHVNGGGSAERREFGGSWAGLYVHLRSAGYPEGYRVLCHSCNKATHHSGVCPHQAEGGPETVEAALAALPAPIASTGPAGTVGSDESAPTPAQPPRL